MPELSYKQANRRYIRTFTPVMIFYCVFCFTGPFLLAALEEAPKWAFALVAVVTAAPLISVFWLLARLLRETDEYTRKIQVDALLAGGAFTLSLAVVWAFLELFQVVPRAQYFPAMIMVGPAFFGAYGLAYFLQWLRRR